MNDWKGEACSVDFKWSDKRRWMRTLLCSLSSLCCTSPFDVIRPFITRHLQEQRPPLLFNSYSRTSARLSRAVNLHPLSCFCTPISIKSSPYLQPYFRVTPGLVNADWFVNAGGDTWNASHPTVEHFWSIVHDMTYEEKQKLLLFVTGEGCSLSECVVRSVDTVPWLSFNYSACLSVCLLVCLLLCLSVYQSVSQSVSQSVCLSVSLSVCLSISQSVCLSVC